MAEGKWKGKQEIDFKYNLKKYWEFLRKYKLLVFTLVTLILVISALNVVDKFLFRAIIDRGNEFVNGDLTKSAYIDILLIVAGVFVFISLLKAGSSWIKLHLTNILDSNIMRDLKIKYFNHIIHLSHKFHTTHKTGSMISRLIKGSSAMERMSDFMIFNLLPLVFQIVVLSLSLAYFNWQATIVIILTSIVFIGYSLWIQNLQKKSNLKANLAEDVEKGTISDIFTNVDSIKHFGKEYAIKRRFEKLSETTRKALMKNWAYFRWFDAGQVVILALGVFFLIYYPLMGFLEETITVGELVLIYTLYGNMIGPLFGFVHGMRGFYRSMADFEDIFEYGKIENDIKDKHGAPELEIKDGEIEFKKVAFSYHKRKIFPYFNLKINKHEKVALVGHSGSGKTTLIKLLYRLYDIDSGDILIDGKNIKDVKQESLRGELSIVPQECILFDDTLYNNIHFSNPSASRKEVMNAIKFAQLDKIITKFPLKENTIVGERGVRLSGGEKQRVSIARAILANKKVIVLDEATSALDSQTEFEIQKDLEKLLENRTSIIIAHRLSTIMKADKIVVLDNGRIVQMGKHNELINQPGVYKQLWNLQNGGYLKE
ncbi:hypothetical protein COU54_04185 [Candidatus Pacearchaeota archaeon CG10_big_fil_rev_8_21_14_0_10_31_24]|nr:MAG: hypothetical protein COU54_04185 [Candidatus Pacearchaeota archaeon CG10_big_fil_rev_8_21_14_0_10_31_24]